MRKNWVTILGLLVISSMLSACASVPMAGLEADQKAKEFATTPGKGRIYIYRDENFGSAIKVPVSVDGKLLGQTAAKTFYVVDVAPGPHKVACMAESNSEVTVNLKASDIAYIWQEMKMGTWTAGCKVQQVNEGAGQEAVKGCKLAQIQQ